MFKFKDFNPAAIARLVNPPRKQLSLLQMQGDAKIIEYFQTPKRAVAFTPTARPFLGEMQWKDDEFLFHCKTGTRQIRNKQRLIISFNLDGIEHYTQTETKLVFPTHVILAALPLRYHQRFDIQAPIWIHPVAYDDITSFMTGEIIIRRKQRQTVATTGIHYFLHEQIVKQGGEQVEDYSFSTPQTLFGNLVEISQGGCSIALSRDAEPILKSTRMLCISTTLDDGRKLGNIDCFVAVRKIQSQQNATVVRCTFLESLPLAIDHLKNGVQSYDLHFKEPCKFSLNGRIGSTNQFFQTALPLGYNRLHVKWSSGTEATYVIMIQPQSPSLIVVSPESGVMLNQDLQKSS